MEIWIRRSFVKRGSELERIDDVTVTVRVRSY
jgi:hypothetical protein